MTDALVPKTVLIVGGYGNFGSYIAKRLACEPTIQLVIAGRSLDKATAFCQSLDAVNQPVPVALDITHNLANSLAAINPHSVIHTSGPFQAQDAFVARACIDQGCHYIDLADGKDFVTSITALDAAARDKGLLVVSGASSVPCLSSCLIDHYQGAFDPLTHVEYGITTAQKTNRGLATTAAVLSYAGAAFDTLIDGHMQKVYGWQNVHRHDFNGLGKRFLGNCDIPDLALFPARYPNLKTVRFYAGLEISVMHLGLWGLSWLRRLRLLPPLNRLAPFLLKSSFLFDHFGSDTSAFFMTLSGMDQAGKPKQISFDLTARSGDGPFIPCMPAVLLARALTNGTLHQTGAMPCVGLITLDDYLQALKTLDISWTETHSD